MNPFKVGDRVRITGGGYYSFDDAVMGKIATVVEAGSDAVGVCFDAADFPADHPNGPDAGGRGWWYLAGDFEAVEQAPRRFQVGDKVRIVVGYHSEMQGGFVTTVERVSPHGVAGLRAPGRTGDRDHFDIYYHSDFHLELVEAFDAPVPEPVQATTQKTPARVRAQHAAERLVADLFACTRTEAREDRLLRHAYRAAYKAFRKCQKDGAP
jgi:hypothetical protein